MGSFRTFPAAQYGPKPVRFCHRRLPPISPLCCARPLPYSLWSIVLRWRTSAVSAWRRCQVCATLGSEVYRDGQRSAVAANWVTGQAQCLLLDLRLGIVREYIVAGQRDPAEVPRAVGIARVGGIDVCGLGFGQGYLGGQYRGFPTHRGFRAREHLEVNVRPAAIITAGKDRREPHETALIADADAAQVVGVDNIIERVVSCRVAGPDIDRMARERRAGGRIL